MEEVDKEKTKEPSKAGAQVTIENVIDSTGKGNSNTGQYYIEGNNTYRAIIHNPGVIHIGQWYIKYSSYICRAIIHAGK